MNKSYLAFLFIGAFCISVLAEEVTTRRDCNHRCNTSERFIPDKQQRHEEKMIQIQEKMKSETDPEKIKVLEKEKNNEVERFKAERERICEDICKLNPER